MRSRAAKSSASMPPPLSSSSEALGLVMSSPMSGLNEVVHEVWRDSDRESGRCFQSAYPEPARPPRSQGDLRTRSLLATPGSARASEQDVAIGGSNHRRPERAPQGARSTEQRHRRPRIRLVG